MRSGPADRLIITQSSAELAIEESWTASIERGAYHRSVTYRLDGSEVKSSVRGSELTSTSSWDGGKLVTMVKQEVQLRGGNSRTTETKEIRLLSEDGQMLTIETVVTSEGGGENKNTLIFKRVTT
jgi:hypothetical protein